MNKLIVLAGETASGKSQIALSIAKKHSGEIICADSWTVRKHMDIGTAKPSLDDQKAVPHHLLDVAEPDQDFNAAAFKTLALKAIADIQERGKLPIMVGGTGLYIDAVCYDYSFLSEQGDEVRAELNSETIDQLLKRAQQNDVDLSGVDIRNKRRIIRAIEAGGEKPSRSALRPNTLVLGIKLPADSLRERVEQRVDAMLAAGLGQEARALSQQYGWEAEAMKGIGYREWQEYFDGNQTLEQTRERIIRATLGLAKRQRTWFKRNQDIEWFSDSEQLEARVAEFLAE